MGQILAYIGYIAEKSGIYLSKPLFMLIIFDQSYKTSILFINYLACVTVVRSHAIAGIEPLLFDWPLIQPRYRGRALGNAFDRWS